MKEDLIIIVYHAIQDKFSLKVDAGTHAHLELIKLVILAIIAVQHVLNVMDQTTTNVLNVTLDYSYLMDNVFLYAQLELSFQEILVFLVEIIV